MKTGANRTIAGNGGFFLDEPRPKPLGKLGRIDFIQFPLAERDIQDAFVSYKSRVRAEQNAPGIRLLQKKINGLARSIQIFRDQIDDFMETGEDNQMKMEFKATIRVRTH